MLDAECFAFLARALESPLAPTVVLATNRGVCAVREGGGGGGGSGGNANSGDPFYSETLAPHGVPVDLLDRAVIVRAAPLSAAEAAQVIALRAGVEGVSLDEAALARKVRVPWFPEPPCVVSVTDALLQVCMHSQHHRGQNMTRLKALGAKALNVDYLIWLWKQKPDGRWS